MTHLEQVCDLCVGHPVDLIGFYHPATVVDLQRERERERERKREREEGVALLVAWYIMCMEILKQYM